MDILGFIQTLGLKALVFGAIIAFILGAGWLHARMLGRQPVNEVRPGPMIVGTGWFAFLIGAGLTWVLINAERMVGPGQFWPFVAAWAGFTFGGLWLLLIEGRFVLHHDTRGLRYRGRFGGWRETRWSEVVDSAYIPAQQILALLLRDGRQIRISTLCTGLDAFAHAAEFAGVPGFAPEPGWSPEHYQEGRY